MGVNLTTHKLLLDSVPKPWKDKRLVLMGDLFVRKEMNLPYKKASEYYRTVFKEAVSMDINGKADVTVDFCKPIVTDEDPTYKLYFDVLINGGTGEHVPNQIMFYCNCHDIVKTDGVIIHIGPEEGSFADHCPYYYTTEFYYRMARTFGYSIISIDRVEHTRGWAIYAAYRKG